jgi:Xaa-Pro aminopeptidase
MNKTNTIFNDGVYIERRRQLKQLVQKGIILLLGNEQSSMTYKDTWYPFRQESSFLYFTGLNLPIMVSIIDIDNKNEIIF